MSSPALHLDFHRHWQAEILPSRPLILPQRNYFYPAQVEEVERGALELIVRSAATPASPFLATCALGFKASSAPSGVWACPNPEELCAVSGGYAYILDVTHPERFSFLPLRPVMQVLVAMEPALLLFLGHREILAWGANGLQWTAEKLSDEGITEARIEGSVLHARGWSMMTDKEFAFTVDLTSGTLSL